MFKVIIDRTFIKRRSLLQYLNFYNIIKIGNLIGIPDSNSYKI